MNVSIAIKNNTIIEVLKNGLVHIKTLFFDDHCIVDEKTRPENKFTDRFFAMLVICVYVFCGRGYNGERLSK